MLDRTQGPTAQTRFDQAPQLAHLAGAVAVVARKRLSGGHGGGGDHSWAARWPGWGSPVGAAARRWAAAVQVCGHRR